MPSSSVPDRRDWKPPTFSASDGAGWHGDEAVGAGPSGSACAYWLAQAGWSVCLIEKKHFPREKTWGDGLTPRSVLQLREMGLEDVVAENGHRFKGLRGFGFGASLEMNWPEHPVFPNYGYTITRFNLDGLVAERAESFGAVLLGGVEAVALLEPTEAPNGGLRGAAGVIVKDKDSDETGEIRGRFLIVGDGQNSRLGRELGTVRNKSWPMGMALRGYYTSDRHDEPWIDSHLDIRDPKGDVVPGYGWIFPLGDGRVNVGVGLLSTGGAWKGVNTGLALGPRTGANTLTIGDAAGTVNPFNGEGIAYGYETGRLAASVIGDALLNDDASLLPLYDDLLESAYGDYYKVARAFVRVISEPKILSVCVGVGMRVEPLMTTLLAIMANLMRNDKRGPAEVGYQALLRLADVIPEQAYAMLLGDTKTAS